MYTYRAFRKSGHEDVLKFLNKAYSNIKFTMDMILFCTQNNGFCIVMENEHKQIVGSACVRTVEYNISGKCNEINMLCVKPGVLTKNIMSEFILKIIQTSRIVIFPAHLPVYLNRRGNISRGIYKCDIFPKTFNSMKGIPIHIENNSSFSMVTSIQEYNIVNNLQRNKNTDHLVYDIKKSDLFLDFISDDERQFYRFVYYDVISSKKNLMLYDSIGSDYSSVSKYMLDLGICDTVSFHTTYKHDSIIQVYYLDYKTLHHSVIKTRFINMI